MACCSAARSAATRAYLSASYAQGRPVACQPPLTRLAAPSTSRTLSMVSSRLRLRSTRVSSAAVDIVPCSASVARVARTTGSGGKASEAK